MSNTTSQANVSAALARQLIDAGQADKLLLSPRDEA